MKIKLFGKILILLYLSSPIIFAQEVTDLDKEILTKHVKALCTTETAGRLPGTKGIEIAKDYIINEWKIAGIAPFFASGYSSDFEIISKNKFLRDKNKLIIHDQTESKSIVSDCIFQPIYSSENSDVSDKEVVFVGYGISDKDIPYDDYAGIDVKDKIILMLRYDPNESIDERYNPNKHASWNSKFHLAKEKGAVAVILFNGFNSKLNGQKDTVQTQKYDFFLKADDNKIPFIHVKQSFIQEIEALTKTNFSEIQKEIDQNKKPNSFVIPKIKLSLKIFFEKTIVTTSNIVGYIPGSDPQLKKEFIVVGAHYDHVGLGTFGSRTYRNNSNMIHPGADDNASGTSAVIEIGKYLKNKSLKRSVLLICFSGEEMGLFGSINFINQNPDLIKSVKAMINFDMVGFYREIMTVRTNGIDTCKSFRSLFESISPTSLKFTYTMYSPEKGLSDHSTFFAKNIPCLHYMTGNHERYHHPSDKPETLNYEGLSKIILHGAKFTEKLLNLETEILFNLDFRPKPNADPGINCTTANGQLKILSLVENYPAAKAGLKPGDIILEMDHVALNSAMDYFMQIRDYNADSKLVFLISRVTNNVTEKLEITLDL